MPRAIVEFKCPEPGCDSDVVEALWVSEPDLSAERMSDGDAIEEHVVNCPECDAHFSIETVNGLGGFYAILNGNVISMSLDYAPDPDDYEDFLLNYFPGSTAKRDFELAVFDVIGLLDIYTPPPASILSRMIYSQLIAIMEAYLSDKILQLSSSHLEIKQRLARKADFVQNQNIKLSEILIDPAKAENVFKIGLQSLLYHDLGKVEKLYNVAFESTFFPPNTDVKEKLEEAVKIRHDCVHRNGKDKDGNIHRFDAPTIKALATNIVLLIDHLENRIEKALEALYAP